jgi:hypothetical protein
VEQVWHPRQAAGEAVLVFILVATVSDGESMAKNCVLNSSK